MKQLVSSTQKLIPFLQGQLGDYSGKFLRRLLEANLCRINGKVERFGSRTVQGGDVVELAPSWKSMLTPKLVEFKKPYYEDEFLKVVDKPAGWVCTDKEAFKVFGPKHYLVHRLDKDTTGLLILAKSSSSREGLMELFERREVAKQYVAIVDGIPREKEGVRHTLFTKKGSYEGQTIWGSSPQGLYRSRHETLNLDRAKTPGFDDRNSVHISNIDRVTIVESREFSRRPKSMFHADCGITAITRWKVLATGKQASCLLCEPETGRTHQIRVHVAEMGHPLLVDRQYARSFRCPLFIQRPLLHAYRLQFSFQGKEIDVTAPLPLDIQETVKAVGICLPAF